MRRMREKENTDNSKSELNAILKNMGEKISTFELDLSRTARDRSASMSSSASSQSVSRTKASELVTRVRAHSSSSSASIASHRTQRRLHAFVQINKWNNFH